jgi:hypothetical protein
MRTVAELFSGTVPGVAEFNFEPTRDRSAPLTAIMARNQHLQQGNLLFIRQF